MAKFTIRGKIWGAVGPTDMQYGRPNRAVGGRPRNIAFIADSNESHEDTVARGMTAAREMDPEWTWLEWNEDDIADLWIERCDGDIEEVLRNCRD